MYINFCLVKVITNEAELLMKFFFYSFFFLCSCKTKYGSCHKEFFLICDFQCIEILKCKNKKKKKNEKSCNLRKTVNIFTQYSDVERVLQIEYKSLGYKNAV